MYHWLPCLKLKTNKNMASKNGCLWCFVHTLPDVLQLGQLWGSHRVLMEAWEALPGRALGMQHPVRRLPRVSFCPAACSLERGKAHLVVWLWKHKYTAVSITFSVQKTNLLWECKWPKLLFHQSFSQMSVKGKAVGCVCQPLGAAAVKVSLRFLRQEPGWSTSTGRLWEHDQVTAVGCYKMRSSGLCCSEP